MYQEWKNYNISQAFDYTCRVNSSNEALVSGDVRLTYPELQRRVFELAHGLRTLGIGKGSRIGVIMPNSTEWACLCLALFRLGAVIIPLNLTWTGRELAQSLELTDAEVLVTIDSFRGTNYVDSLMETFPELANGGRDRVFLGQYPNLTQFVTLSREGIQYPFSHDYHALVALGGDYRAEGMLALADEVSPADECLCLPTSGTTGFPKPVTHTHSSLMSNCSNFADAIEFTSSDRMLNFGATYHIAGFLLLVIPFLRGGTMHQMEWFDPEAALGIIEKERITTIWGFAIHYLMMKRHVHFGAYNIKSLERTLVGSDPSYYEEIRSMGLEFHGNIYGCSEYLSNLFPYRDRFDEKHMRLSHGRPVDSVEQKIANTDTGETLGFNEIGEICVKGPGLFKGYYKMPDLTASVIDADGFFHTGDLGSMDEKGYTYYRGRLKDIVKTGGENVSAREVEMFLEGETPWVTIAQVFGVPDSTWGEAVTAAVQVKTDTTVSEDELRSFCRGKLAGYKIPKRFLFVGQSDWVVTPTGKLDKTAMRERALVLLGIEETLLT